MTINEREVNGIVILDLIGKLTLGEGPEMLKEKVTALLAQGKCNFILNFAEVPYIDSMGLYEVVSQYTAASRRGGQLKLMNLPPRIKDLLAITKLTAVFDTFGSEAEAVASFRTQKLQKGGQS